MKNSGIWRSVEEWKSALMTLPDNSFFELLRSVFGNIKTPFNKQKLLEDLFNFLSRNEIRKNIAAYIDERDHKVIAAITLLDEPAPGDLESFFSGELSCAELQSLLLNLEERLILNRFRDEKILRLALNPVLEPVLAPLIADSRCLFPFVEGDSAPEEIAREIEKTRPLSAPPSVGNGAPPGNAGRHGKPAKTLLNCVSDGRILAALFALLLDEEDLFKAEGVLRKKILDEGKKFFPDLDLELAAQVLLRLELFRCDRRGLIPLWEKIEDYSGLPRAEREEYWAAGLYLCLNERNGTASSSDTADSSAAHTGGFRLSRNRPRTVAAFVHRFRALAVPGKRYPEITLRRIWELLEKEAGKTGNAWGASLFYPGGSFPFGPFLEAMAMTGLLKQRGGLWETAVQEPARERKNSGKGAPEEPVIVMDTAFSFIIYPEISFADALELSAFCSLKENSGTAVSFELTRFSAVRGFDRGMVSAGIIELLSRLSGNRLDMNLSWTLKEWENRYTGVSLNQGIVLSLAEDRRYLAEAGPVASLIRRTLAPGVYLLSQGDRSEAVKALRKAGVDIIAQPPYEPAKDDAGPGFSRNSFPRLTAGIPESPPIFSASKNGAGEGEKNQSAFREETESIKRKFREILEKMRVTRPEREELLARIERRLVLTGAQLEDASLRYEKLEARGLDYVGKAVIAKQAIEAGSVLEVFWPGQGGVVNKIAGFPRTIEKKEGESILVLKSLSRAEENSETEYSGGGNSARVTGDTVRIPLGKISLLRRIKQSIFGG